MFVPFWKATREAEGARMSRIVHHCYTDLIPGFSSLETATKVAGEENWLLLLLPIEPNISVVQATMF